MMLGVGIAIGSYLTLTNLFSVSAATTDWNINTSGEYTYNTNDIEFVSGSAQLKASAVPGVGWDRKSVV